MLVNLYTAAITGLNPRLIKVEIDISKGLPYFSVVGLADASVKESWARVKGAIINSGLSYPKSKITINLAPGWIRKKGSHFDLSFALGILVATKQINIENLEKTCVIGELSLDGSVNKCAGILPMIMEAKKEGFEKVIIPQGNLPESMFLSGVKVIGAKSLGHLMHKLRYGDGHNEFVGKEGTRRRNPAEALEVNLTSDGEISDAISVRDIVIEKNNQCKFEEEEYKFQKDFKDVRGQNAAKHAVVIAVAGGHSLMMTGCPGIGKTMIAERIPEIMPSLSYDEALELTLIYSAAGKLSEDKPIIRERPFRNPGSLITKSALIGGGFPPTPGEVTFAHRGVLFLDELGEMRREIVDTLRRPLEDKTVLLVRRGEKFVFPADFFLIGAKNPCKCGYFGSKTKQCTCSRKEILDYQKNLSGPINDRIHMHITLPEIIYEDLELMANPENNMAENLGSKEMKKIIIRVREIQKERYKNEDFDLNGNIEAGKVETYCRLDEKAKEFVAKAYKQLSLNPRTYSHTLKVARTIADIEESKDIEISHLAQAIQYREQVIR